MEVPLPARSPWPTADRLVILLGALVLMLAAASKDDSSITGDPRSLDLLAVALLVVGGGLVVAASRFPASVATAAMALTFGWYGVGYTSGLINVVTVIAFYRLGSSDHALRKLVVTGASVAASLVVIAGISGESWWEALTAAGYVAMAVLFGELIRSRRLLEEQHAAEAAQVQRDAQRRIAEERLQIARDVHDLLAHTISSMTVQAAVATDAIGRDEQAAAHALASIRHAGRTAMQEMRTTVSLLRSGTEAAAPAPAPHLGRLDELVGVAREHGVEIDLVLDPPTRPLPELVELTAYRIVQESLTNTLRHADASHAVVTVSGEPSCLTVEIHDNGQTSGPSTPGFGLRGMAERVESLGGQLWHGVDDDGGWTVRARMPLSGGPP